jgi:hypothetical protein
MKFRITLYLLSIIAYGFSIYFADKAPDNAKSLFDFWLLLFAFIVLETANHVRDGLYVLFPVGYLVGLALQFFNVGEGMVYQGIGAWIHLLWGIWLLYLVFNKASNLPYVRNVVLFVAIGSLIFGLNGFQYFFNIDALSQLLNFRLSSYLLIASTGQFLLTPNTSSDHPQLTPIFRLILIIHIYLLVGKVITNIF